VSPLVVTRISLCIWVREMLSEDPGKSDEQSTTSGRPPAFLHRSTKVLDNLSRAVCHLTQYIAIRNYSKAPLVIKWKHGPTGYLKSAVKGVSMKSSNFPHAVKPGPRAVVFVLTVLSTFLATQLFSSSQR
jgi:hypothetical protein